MDIKVLGIGPGQTVCSLARLDTAGAVVFRKHLQRHRLLDFLDKLPTCVVAPEACSGAPHIGRFCIPMKLNRRNYNKRPESHHNPNFPHGGVM